MLSGQPDWAQGLPHVRDRKIMGAKRRTARRRLVERFCCGFLVCLYL